MIRINLEEIKKLWNKEKEEYKKKEIGTGSENFVKKLLECEDLFKLKEGLLKTKRENRKNEFIHRHKTKGRREADFIVFINSDIVIPIEVELSTHIDRGIEQLYNYQKDLEKKYGILTDGSSWRFYNNQIIEKEFTIYEIFDNPQLFLNFWKEYIKPIHYYTAFFKGEFSEKNELAVEQNYKIFFEDTTSLIKNLKNKLENEGYFNEGYFAHLKPKQREKEVTQIVYAYLIQFILYKTLVDNDFDDFKEEYKEYLMFISDYINSFKFKDIFGIIEGISEKISKNIYRPFKNEQNVISEKIKQIYHKPKNELSDISPWLDIFVYIKKYSFRNIQNDIFGYIYENYLKEMFSEEDLGQYYTHPAIVNFMIKQIGYTFLEIREKINNNQQDKISIIDPSCGSGTFLYTAVDSIIQTFSNSSNPSKKIQELVSNNIFGLDIEEFPLYLAEMSILMRLLPFIINEKYNNPFDKKIKVFKTEDSISEFIGTGIDNAKEAQLNILAFQEPQYKSFMRDKDEIKEMKQSLIPRSGIPRLRFDYVIGNPPYVSYNKCSKQGLESFRLIKQGKLKLNNIYGVNLHSVPGNRKKYRPNPNLYTFFIALGLGLLKKNGKLCYIIPQTVLINPDFDVIRYHLAKYVTIKKIINFKGKMFVGRGINQKKSVPTSSLIFLIEKSTPSDEHKVEIINYNFIDDSIEGTLDNILKGKGVNEQKILQKDLLNNISNWNFIKQDALSSELYKEYNKNDKMEIYYNHKIAESKFGSRFYFDGGYSIDERNVLNQPENRDIIYYRFPKLNDNFWTIKDTSGYWPNIRKGNSKLVINLRECNQGYNLLDSKYKLIWSYNNTTRFFFTDLPLIWARNKILGIGTENKRELCYLFSILNSKITNYILKKYVKIEQEDTRTILVSLQIIKGEIKVPKIDETNKDIKDEIINKTEEILDLENKRLSDFVDFSGILTQKFDSIKVKENKLQLIKVNDITEIKIKSQLDLIRKILNSERTEKEIYLSDIKNLKIIDYEKQNEIKNYVDDLIFALYFNIKVKSLGLIHAKEIKNLCEKNNFYKLLS